MYQKMTRFIPRRNVLNESLIDIANSQREQVEQLKKIVKIMNEFLIEKQIGKR